MESRDLIVIPARYGSTRLPGKPLMALAGRTLLERVIANAREAADLCGNCDFVVATDDERIAEHANALDARSVLTDAALETASGVTGARFCHNARFIAVAATREAVLAMADLAVAAAIETESVG